MPDNTIETNPARLQTVQAGFRWRSVQLRNQLPSELISVLQLRTFKTELKKLIINRRPQQNN